MGDFVEIATSVISRAQRRVEISAQNISNISTPGYKRRMVFDGLVSRSDSNISDKNADTVVDFSDGKITETGNPADFAILGDGFFAVRKGESVYYTRHGQFERAPDGRLISGKGFALQAEAGADLVLKPGDFELLGDGTVLQDGAPIARLALFQFSNRRQAAGLGDGLFDVGGAEPKRMEAPAVRQGALETSNVSTGDEMVAIMEALRRAETGQRMVMVYDDLIGRALNTFGQA